LPLEQIESEICTLAGQIAAATSRYLCLLAEFDERQGWMGWNVRSCPQWLSWRCGLDLRTAREHLRVARQLRALPLLQEAFGAGRLSYSKVRAISRVAVPENEAALVEGALHATAAQIDRLTRGMRTALEQPVPGQGPPTIAPPRLGVRWRWDEHGCLVLWGRLEADEGARLLAAATRAQALHDQTQPEPGRSEPTAADCARDSIAAQHTHAAPIAGQCAGADSIAGRSSCRDRGSAEPPVEHAQVLATAPADLAPGLAAMAELACTELEAPIFAAAAEVWVHVDAATLVAADAANQQRATTSDIETDRGRRGVEAPVVEHPAAASGSRTTLDDADGPGPAQPAPDLDSARSTRPARLDDGPALDDAVMSMLACNAWLRRAVRGADDRITNLGRRVRRPSRRQYAALFVRDRGCTVPGCGRTRFLHAHHVVAWSRGGATSLDNLILLCGDHHRSLHRGEFQVLALGGERFRFLSPRGGQYPAAPPVRGAQHDLADRFKFVSPNTIQSGWQGDPLDLDWAVACYLEEAEPRAWSAAAGSETELAASF